MISPGAAAVAPACSMKRRGNMTEASPRLSRRWLLGAGVAGAGALGGLPLLSGCSTSGGKSGGNDGPKPTGAPLQIGAEVSDGPTYKSGYVGPHATVKKPFGDGKTTFKIVVPQDTQVVGDWNKNKTTEWFEKLTGVKVQFQEVLITNPNGGTDLTKINAMLSGGDLPDAFMGIPFTPAQISLYGQQGTFVAWTTTSRSTPRRPARRSRSTRTCGP